MDPSHSSLIQTNPSRSTSNYKMNFASKLSYGDQYPMTAQAFALFHPVPFPLFSLLQRLVPVFGIFQLFQRFDAIHGIHGHINHRRTTVYIGSAQYPNPDIGRLNE